MDNSSRLTSYLEQIKAELIITDYFESEIWWKDMHFLPDYHKFYFLTEGDCWFEVGSQKYHAVKGDLCLLPAGMEQSYYLSETQYMKKYWCHFSAFIGERQMTEVVETPLIVKVRDMAKVENLFRKMRQFYKSDNALDTLRLRATLLELLCEYLALCDTISVKPSVYSTEFSKVMDYIDKHFDQNIKVDTLAELIHLQPNYFIKYFKKNFGDSPMKYVNKLRMEKAKDLLKHSDVSVGEIAKRVGIEDNYYFSRLFKKYAGVSPRSYRDI